MTTFIETVLLTCLIVFAHGADASEPLTDQIHELVTRAHHELHFHGNIEVRLGDDIIYKKSMGIAVDEFDVSHTDKSRFLIASVSKQFTAAAVLKLQELGKIHIDDPISEHLDFGKNPHPKTAEQLPFITIRQLLTHTAGTMRDVRATEYYNNETYAPFVTSIVFDMARNHDLFPGKIDGQARYSNMGYMLLAMLVQKVSKMDFHDFLRIHFFLPLNMKSTGQYHRMFSIKHLAPGYNYPDGVDELRQRCCFDASSFVGSHSLYSDVGDLMNWLEDIHSGDSLVLSQASLTLMMSPQAEFSDKARKYGFGFMIDEVLGYKRVWHDGFEYGYLSLASSVPEAGLKIVILGNRHDAEVSYNNYYSQILNDQISELVLNSLL